jgi:hypothetical protein
MPQTSLRGTKQSPHRVALFLAMTFKDTSIVPTYLLIPFLIVSFKKLAQKKRVISSKITRF